ncbi:hypothetical protein BKA83DRAFT_4192424 [Pisolithus microcarpus]|nr:hypothetical protein BKA83DRAFT_4192424 [Pisolithus microcarpus]
MKINSVNRRHRITFDVDLPFSRASRVGDVNCNGLRSPKLRLEVLGKSDNYCLWLPPFNHGTTDKRNAAFAIRHVLALSRVEPVIGPPNPRPKIPCPRTNLRRSQGDYVNKRSETTAIIGSVRYLYGHLDLYRTACSSNRTEVLSRSGNLALRYQRY